MTPPTRIVFLGGLGEIGRNCMFLEVEGRILLVDCGLMFPEVDMPGVDLVLPDFTYLREHADAIEGVVLTHAHEDHSGALSFLLRDASFPIYAAPLSLGMAANRIRESGLIDRTELIPVADGERRTIGPFEVEFVSIASIIEKLRARAQKLPAGAWVEGYFHDDTKLTDKRQLVRQDLDKVSTEHPVVVRHRGGHTSFYNTKALEMAKVTRETPNPPGGTFDKDASGDLTGRVTDRATAVFQGVGTRERPTADERARRERAGIAHISKEFARYGLTSVHHEGGDLAAIQDVRAAGDLRHRVSYEAQGGMVDTMITNGIKTGFGDEWVRFGATSEHTVDGSFSERTMALSIVYPGRTDGYKGNVTETQDVLDAWVERVVRAGIQPNIHANGDVAIDSYLTAVERAVKKFPTTDLRPKITHCTLINDDLIRRIKALDAIPSCFTTYAYYNTDKFPFYGEDLMKRSMAFRTMLDAGIHAAAGSDFSPGPFAEIGRAHV